MATLQTRLKALEAKRPIEKTEKVQYLKIGQGQEGWDLKTVEGASYDDKMARVCEFTLGRGDLSPEERYQVRAIIETGKGFLNRP